MLQFSKLRLLGFKSFVDPVELEIFTGLTGIVGPNGCGKSNLLEALRWVMGENRPSSMRSGAMDDVIFAGAGTRVPKNYAEVSLGLENVDQDALGFKIQSGLVEVVRRVTRELGSSYRLNGKDVRAKDISMLFADSSTGAHSPSLVRQGQISELINANPKSRRRLLEEAAGISGLYQRRHEAELKLKASESNMARLKDVIEQLESQIKALEKQSKQASKYKQLAQEIRDNEAFLLCKKWMESESDLLQESGMLVERTKLLASAEVELMQVRTKREKMEKEVPYLRNEETLAAAALQRLVVEKDGIEAEEQRARDNILELKRRAEETEKDSSRQNILINDALEVIRRINWEVGQLKKLSNGQDKSIKNSEEDVLAATKKLSEDELKLDSESEDFARLTARFQNIQKLMEKGENDLEKIRSELKESDNQVISLISQIEEKQQDLAVATQRFNKCKFEAKNSEIALKNYETKRLEAVGDETEKQVDFSTMEGKLAGLQSESKALEGLLESRSGKSPQILDQLKVLKGYEVAVGAAFSDDIKAPIIFSNNKTGWFQLPELEPNLGLPDGVLAMSEKVSAPDPLKKRLTCIGLVEPDEGPKLQRLLKPGQKLVSKDGSLWRWDGYCVRGNDNLSESALRLKQENRLTDLSMEISKTETKAKRIRKDFEQAKVKSSDAENAVSLARSVLSDSDKKQSEASRQVSGAESHLSILKAKLQSLRESSLVRQENRKVLEAELAEFTSIFHSLDDLELKKHCLEEQRSVVEKSRALMVEKRAIYDQERRDASTRRSRMDELDQDKKNWTQRLSRANESVTELDKRKVAVTQELEKAAKTPNSLETRRVSLGSLIDSATKNKVEASENLSKRETSLRLILNAERDLGGKASKLREEIARANALKESAELNLNRISKLIQEQTLKDPVDLIENLPINIAELPDVQTIEDRLFSLKVSRDTLGAVNLRAADDAQDLTGEWNNLISEKLDLDTAIKKLRSAIITLNTQGRSRLLEAFTEVNNYFGDLFKSLFGGGKAKLTFVDGEDPLDAGLEIICQPPGKKLATLSLLSGGEQTLTALALIFAVFKANPSPICVLDEVDAPLDDANVERFCGLLDEMTRTTNTRFMIITHHPLTMSRMDRLYGVTMVERGVSQVVSVDLKRAEELLDV
tara:strand:+ start:2080 stop:5541 length:3462 start_codon:yes stop_codon:yes gene_type:complete